MCVCWDVCCLDSQISSQIIALHMSTQFEKPHSVGHVTVCESTKCIVYCMTSNYCLYEHTGFVTTIILKMSRLIKK